MLSVRYRCRELYSQCYNASISLHRWLHIVPHPRLRQTTSELWCLDIKEGILSELLCAGLWQCWQSAVYLYDQFFQVKQIGAVTSGGFRGGRAAPPPLSDGPTPTTSRRHCLNALPLTAHRSNLEVRRNFFTERLTNRWSSLAQWTLDADSINAFKSHLQRLRNTRMGFFENWCPTNPLAAQVSHWCGHTR